MKKKLISLLLVFAMCLSLGTVALADSEDETLLLPTSVTDEIFYVGQAPLHWRWEKKP